MTATELSQLLSSLHAANAQKIQQIEELLGTSSSSSPNPVSPSRQQQMESQEKALTPHHWFLGLPLDKVVETDNETDRYSCSSASVMKSPSVSHNTPSRPPATPGTPCTPSIAELRLRYVVSLFALLNAIKLYRCISEIDLNMYFIACCFPQC